MSQHLVVIDTNVLASALLSKHTDASTAKVLEAVFTSKIIPLFNEEILKEYDEVLHREKFNFSDEIIHLVIQSIRDNGISAERMCTDEKMIDLNDAVFYEVCLSKRNKKSLLVTGNIKHFLKKEFVLTPTELLAIIEKTC